MAEYSDQQSMSKRITQVKPGKQTSMDQGVSGKVFVNPNTYQQWVQRNNNQQPLYVIVNGYVSLCSQSPDIAPNTLALNSYQRQAYKISLVDDLTLQIFNPPQDQEYRLSTLKLELACIQVKTQNQQKIEIEDEEFIKNMKKNLQNQFLRQGQIFIQWSGDNLFTAKVLETGNIQLGVKQMKELPYGMVVEDTDVILSCQYNKVFGLKNTGSKAKNIFVNDFKFDQLGIGGLDNQLTDIFRRAFASRRFPPNVLSKYGIQHVKGVLMYGPPGTGKTLIARKLAKCLNSVEPKIVNGPSIMSSYVGKSEENIRELFKDAQMEMQQKGDDSQLHIIIFDEMDAICKQRGREAGAGGSAKDGVVNQLLSMLDGVDSLNNILVIGMTNRKDLIDEAILRPGRFEVHIEISLPNESGRVDILKIHTESMRKNNVMSGIDLNYLAENTKNYTGAELESLVKSATSFAFQRVHDIMDMKKQNLDEEVILLKSDFDQALSEIKPAFGFDEESIDQYLRTQLVDYGERFQRILTLLNNSMEQTKNGKSSQLHSVLLEGQVGTGKTSIAAWVAKNCNFPYVQMITPEKFVGYSEGGKINQIVKVFEDAYKSPFSCIILDSIERLIEFIDIGPRFSNGILQALLVLIKKIPKDKNNRILIIGTSSQAKILKELEITQCFNININVPSLRNEEIIPFLKGYNISQNSQKQIAQQVKNVPVKQLQMVLDMVQVQNQDQEISSKDFTDCLDSVNQDN